MVAGGSRAGELLRGFKHRRHTTRFLSEEEHSWESMKDGMDRQPLFEVKFLEFQREQTRWPYRTVSDTRSVFNKYLVDTLTSMDGWLDEWIGGWMDGRMDGRLDGYEYRKKTMGIKKANFKKISMTAALKRSPP